MKTYPEAARREAVAQSRSMRLVRHTARWADTAFSFRLFGRSISFGFDPLIGFLLPEVGDVLTLFCALPSLWVSVVQLRSLPLTLALLYNALMDALVGALPFFVGDVLDFRCRSNVANCRLIEGYLANEPSVRRDVRRRAWKLALGCGMLLLLLGATIYLAARLVAGVWSIIFH